MPRTTRASPWPPPHCSRCVVTLESDLCRLRPLGRIFAPPFVGAQPVRLGDEVLERAGRAWRLRLALQKRAEIGDRLLARPAVEGAPRGRDRFARASLALRGAVGIEARGPDALFEHARPGRIGVEAPRFAERLLGFGVTRLARQLLGAIQRPLALQLALARFVGQRIAGPVGAARSPPRVPLSAASASSVNTRTADHSPRSAALAPRSSAPARDPSPPAVPRARCGFGALRRAPAGRRAPPAARSRHNSGLRSSSRRWPPCSACCRSRLL